LRVLEQQILACARGTGSASAGSCEATLLPERNAFNVASQPASFAASCASASISRASVPFATGTGEFAAAAHATSGL